MNQDKDWRDLDYPFVTEFDTRYRSVLWICSRTTLRVVFYTSVKSDFPPRNATTTRVVYQFAPGPADSAAFRVHLPNWMERDLATIDFEMLLRTQEVRVEYDAWGSRPPNGMWRIVVPDSGRVALASWADSCQSARQ